MLQSQLDFAVSQATGESIRKIRLRGFSLADPIVPDSDPEPYNAPPQVVDWDDVATQRVALFP